MFGSGTQFSCPLCLPLIFIVIFEGCIRSLSVYVGGVIVAHPRDAWVEVWILKCYINSRRLLQQLQDSF